MPEPRYKSTLDMPYDLFVRFKRITQERGETMRDIILKAIEEYVAKHENEKESRK
jgi:macrodomain Ter protein organizer (MatP/YcbG family)